MISFAVCVVICVDLVLSCWYHTCFHAIARSWFRRLTSSRGRSSEWLSWWFVSEILRWHLEEYFHCFSKHVQLKRTCDTFRIKFDLFIPLIQKCFNISCSTRIVLRLFASSVGEFLSMMSSKKRHSRQHLQPSPASRKSFSFPISTSFPHVDLKNASVCRFKTSPCMPATRAHMFQHVCACCRHTRRRFECTHGKRFESTHGGHRQFCLQRTAHVGLSLGPTGSPKVTTGCCSCSSLRKDREQHVPDFSNHSLYLMKIVKQQLLWWNSGGNQPWDGSICLSLPWKKYNERFAR